MKMTFYRTAFFEKVCLISHQTDLEIRIFSLVESRDIKQVLRM